MKMISDASFIDLCERLKSAKEAEATTNMWVSAEELEDLLGSIVLSLEFIGSVDRYCWDLKSEPNIAWAKLALAFYAAMRERQ